MIFVFLVTTSWYYSCKMLALCMVSSDMPAICMRLILVILRGAG